METVSPEGRGEKRPRPDREETLVTQIDEPPSYEEALKQGLPTTRPIAPMATGVSSGKCSGHAARNHHTRRA